MICQKQMQFHASRDETEVHMRFLHPQQQQLLSCALPCYCCYPNDKNIHYPPIAECINGNLQSFFPIPFPSDALIPRSPPRPSIPTASPAIHNNILLPRILLRRRGRRHVSRHTRHQRLCVLPLSRGSVGWVAGLLCERVAVAMAGSLGCG